MQEYVLRFQIEMQNPFLVQESESFGDIFENGEDFVEAEEMDGGKFS